jgi:SAM-dependent methyltransferase
LKSSELRSFHEFEHEGWQTVGGAYHDFFARLTSQTIHPLLDEIITRETKSLLDVACGPGYVAAAAKARGLDVTGIDFSEFMVEIAKRDYPNIAFIEGDAQQLPFSDGDFDAVSMNFGLLHLDQPEQALREAHRVLAASGRFAFTVWATSDKSVAFEIVLNAIQQLGDPNVSLPPGPPFFRFSDPDESLRCMTDAGFTDCKTKILPLAWQLASTDDLFKAFYLGTPRTGGLLRAQTLADLAAIEEKVKADAQKYIVNGALNVPMAAILVSGQRP